MKSSFDERAFGEGYTVKNGYYRKKIGKDVSVFSVDTENVKVRMWKDFEANDPEVNLSLLEENVDAVSFSVIMTLVSAQLTDWENSIFGVSGVASTGDDKASTKTVSYIVGEFEKYAYGEQYKGEVELGKGLVGAILLDFEKNSQKEKAGWEALDAPTWERKLWCSDTFPGPSIREFSTMVASIAATVCTFGAGAALAVAVSAAIMATNELTFELADVGVGYHDWDEAAKNVAKAAVSGAISGASGAAMGAASKVGGIGGVFLKTGITSSSSITTQFTNAFIDGGFSGVKDAFNSWSDWQGIAFSTAGSFVTNGVGYSLANTNFTGFNSLQMSQINSIAGTVGGLTTNALEYAFTGQTSFNLLNLSMFGLEYGSMWGGSATNTLSGGFLSMTIGQNGTHFAISSAGTDISLGTLKLAAAGAKESSKVIDWKYGSVETNSTLNSINMLGYTNIGNNQTLAKDIWNEKISVNYTDTGGDYGNYKGGSTINISSTLLGGGAEDYAKLATVLAHEGTHAYGNRIEGVAHSVGLETYTQINQIYDISGDISFAAEMIEAIKDINSWKENTGDTDHWKIISKADGTSQLQAEYKDGKLVKDLTIEYQDEDGNVLGSVKVDNQDMSDVGQAGSLAKILSAGRSEEILGGKYDNPNLYDDTTLSDVLKLSPEQIAEVRRTNSFDGIVASNTLAENKFSLLGESLLKTVTGAQYNGTTWVDANGNKLSDINIALSDSLLKGSLAAWSDGTSYIYRTLFEEILRSNESYMVFDGKNRDMSKNGKDSRVVHQYDLDGNEIGTAFYSDGWTTVQTLTSTNPVANATPFVNMAYDNYAGFRGNVVVGPETLTEGFVAYQIQEAPDSNFYKNTLLLNYGDIYLQAVAGINSNGNPVSRYGYTALDTSARLLLHPAENYGNTGCGVTPKANFTAYTNYLTGSIAGGNLGLQTGTVIFGDIRQKTTDKNYPYFYNKNYPYFFKNRRK